MKPKLAVEFPVSSRDGLLFIDALPGVSAPDIGKLAFELSVRLDILAGLETAGWFKTDTAIALPDLVVARPRPNLRSIWYDKDNPTVIKVARHRASEIEYERAEADEKAKQEDLRKARETVDAVMSRPGVAFTESPCPHPASEAQYKVSGDLLGARCGRCGYPIFDDRSVAA